jgi:hypothetical protein
MNLLDELREHYAHQGVPRFEQQAADLMRLAHARREEQIAAAARAVAGYVRDKRRGTGDMWTLWGLTDA